MSLLLLWQKRWQREALGVLPAWPPQGKGREPQVVDSAREMPRGPGPR